MKSLGDQTPISRLWIFLYLEVAGILLFCCPVFSQQIRNVPLIMWEPRQSVLPYAINENLCFAAVRGRGIYKSTDGGLSWAESFISLKAVAVSSLFFMSDSIGYAACESNGAYRTTDQGKTWTQFLTETTWDIYAVANQVHCIGASGGLISTDGGETFKSGQAYSGDRGARLGGVRTDHHFWVSEDSGKTFNQRADAPSALNGLYWRPHTGYMGLVSALTHGGEFDSSYVSITTDGAKTIKPIPSPKYPWYLTQAVGGSGCNLFVQGRSIYDGRQQGIQDSGIWKWSGESSIWKYFPTHLGNRPYSFLSATGRGNILFFADYYGYLYKLVDNDSFNYRSRLLDDVEFSRADGTSLQDTININICDSAVINFDISHRGCDGFRITNVGSVWEDLYFERISVTASKHRISSDSFGRSRLDVFPRRRGVFSVGISYSLLRDDWLKEDTTVFVTVRVDSTPAIRKIGPKKLIDFGKLRIDSNQQRADSVSIGNLGCKALSVDSVLLIPDQLGSGFSIAQFQPFTVDTRYSPSWLTVKYKPMQPRRETGKLIIKTDVGSDTVLLVGEGTEAPKGVRTLPLNALALISQVTPNPTFGILTIELNRSVHARYEVLDLLGKDITAGSFIGDRQSIDLSGRTAGTYYLRIDSEGVTETRRVLITK